MYCLCTAGTLYWGYYLFMYCLCSAGTQNWGYYLFMYCLCTAGTLKWSYYKIHLENVHAIQNNSDTLLTWALSQQNVINSLINIKVEIDFGLRSITQKSTFKKNDLFT